MSSYIGIKEIIGMSLGNNNITSFSMGNNIIWDDEPPVPTEEYFLTFSSPNTFTLEIVGGSSYSGWDGYMQYSIDKVNWTEWYGETIDSSQSGKLYLRGSENTYVTGSYASTTRGYFALTGSDISISGNIENLLDYQMVENGQHPPVANYAFQYLFYNCTSIISAPELLLSHPTQYCYRRMFSGCTSLTTPPALPALTLQTSCYRQMFYGCTGLTSIPALPALEPVNYCYHSMFSGCTSVKLSTTQDSEYANEYRIPVSNSGSTSSTNWNINMFSNTGGTFTGTPTINTTYYTSNAVIAPGVIPPRPQTYLLSATVIDGTIIGNSTTIAEGETKTFTIVPNTGLILPQAITASNCSYIWNAVTGELVVSNPTGTVTIQVNCTYEPYLTFSSPISFSMSVGAGNKSWDGTIEYSTDKENWTVWDGISVIHAANDGTKYNFYIRGTGNTNITNASSNNHWHISSGSVSISGSIEAILDYQTVALGGHPSIGRCCFESLFYMQNNISDISSLKLPATTLNFQCYREMFWGCKGLTTLPSDLLPATTLAEGCYYGMFKACRYITSIPDNFLPARALAYECYASMFEGCTGLTTIPDNILPATTLASECYIGMFSDCTSLTTMPTLPAVNLASYCYYNMFLGCSSLTSLKKLPAISLYERCYWGMFSNCSSLTTAPADLLPATTLAQYCYINMFSGCTKLTAVPALPATTLAASCYGHMFGECTSLTTAPELLATTLASYCYSEMFSGCTNLTSAPSLPATTLATSCYSSMFYGCTKLTTAPTLSATTLANNCYDKMFYGCLSLATAPSLPATTLAKYCYRDMFYNCGIQTLPKLPATTLAIGCYQRMFYLCSYIQVSETQDSTYVNIYRIPESGIGTDNTNSLADMFYGTTGSFQANTPTINTTYYTSNTIV